MPTATPARFFRALNLSRETANGAVGITRGSRGIVT
jgi:hypothetical protein